MDGIKQPNTKDGKPTDALQYEGKVKKSYVPEGFKTQEDFLQDMREEYEADLEFDRLNREEALEDKRFAAGEQWDPIVLEHRKGLPCLTINNIPQFVAQLVGDWRMERPAIKVLAAEDGDTDLAEIRGDLIRGIENQSRASRVYDNAFESSVICGDGAFAIDVEYAKGDVFDQNIVFRAIDDALSVVWDRLSVDPTGRDARHVFVDDLLPKKEFNRKWPEADPSTLNEKMASDMRYEGWIDEAGVRVTEYWRMIERDKLLALFPDGSIHVVDDGNMQKLIDQKGYPVRSRVAPCSYAQMHLVTGFKILAGPYEYKLTRVPIVRMSGRTINVGGRRVRYGLVRFMKDPARLKNFWRSMAAEQLGYAPKAQWLAPESAVEGREDEFRKAHLSRDPLLVFNDVEPALRPERLDPPIPQVALHNESQVNAQDMKDVTGIHDASLGIRSNETSGKAINARKMEGDIASVTFYDNANQALLEAGDVTNQLIPQVCDGTRIMRRLGEDQSQKFIKVNDPSDPSSPDLSVGNYDLALSTGPSFTTRRAEAAEAMMNAVQVWPQIMEVAGDLVVKAQDWPGAEKLAERLKKTIPPQFLDPEDQDKAVQPQAPQFDPQEVAKMIEEYQKLEQKFNELSQDRSIEAEKLRVDWYKAKTDRVKALSDHEVDNNKQALDAIGLLIDAENKDEDRNERRENAERQSVDKAEDRKVKALPKSSSSQKS